MDQFDIAQSFIEETERETHPETLTGVFQRSIDTLGFRYFACGSHVDPLRPGHAVMLITYPDNWVRCFSEMRLHCIDPVFSHASQTFLPFFWDDDEFRADLTNAQRQVLREADCFGIAHGYTIPIHSPRAAYTFRASCSVVPDSPSIDARSYFALQIMACYLFEAATRALNHARSSTSYPRLSRRERECLELAAQGKSDWAIGRLLNVSEFTVHNHIESAKRRLGVATRVQAVVQALATQQVSFGDVIRRQECADFDSSDSRTSDPRR